eukprot:77581-Pleurochrysis_carterae.AAC.1
MNTSQAVLMANRLAAHEPVRASRWLLVVPVADDGYFMSIDCTGKTENAKCMRADWQLRGGNRPANSRKARLPCPCPWAQPQAQRTTRMPMSLIDITSYLLQSPTFDVQHALLREVTDLANYYERSPTERYQELSACNKKELPEISAPEQQTALLSPAITEPTNSHGRCPTHEIPTDLLCIRDYHA